MSTPQKARIENWAIVMPPRTEDDRYRAPELLEAMHGKRLSGYVFDHPRLTDGLDIVTSRLESLDIPKKSAVTRNTTYTLGKPAPDFLRWLKDQGLTLENFA